MKERRGAPPSIDKVAIFSLRDQGMSERNIAKQLGCSRSWVSAVLNPKIRAKRREYTDRYYLRKQKAGLLLRVEEMMVKGKPLSAGIINQIGRYSVGDPEFSRKMNRLLHG